MQIPRILCAWLILAGSSAAIVQAEWLPFAGGGALAIGNWPAGTVLGGPVFVTASNFINGNGATPFIGLTPISVGPNLSADYFATTLQPNPGNIVPSIGTPYNDSGDKYHVVIDFFATTGGPGGVLPAGSIFAILDLDINENYRNITATNVINATITTPWIAGPNGYFDMTNPMIAQGSLVPNPTLTGPVLGVYDMFGVAYNFDVGMWLFQTTQDVRTISFDMERSTGGNTIGGGGATWAFHVARIPEPTCVSLVACALLAAMCVLPKRRRR